LPTKDPQEDPTSLPRILKTISFAKYLERISLLCQGSSKESYFLAKDPRKDLTSLPRILDSISLPRHQGFSKESPLLAIYPKDYACADAKDIVKLTGELRGIR
jgi:hypothetical protein